MTRVEHSIITKVIIACQMIFFSADWAYQSHFFLRLNYLTIFDRWAYIFIDLTTSPVSKKY
jgi:hypothetical protein